MRTALTLLLLVHGAIHALGFLRWALRSPVRGLEGQLLRDLGPTGERIYGVFWLVALVLFLVAAVARVNESTVWWRPAIVALVLSQTLVVLAWRDARAGTIANVVLFLPILVSAAQTRFSTRVDTEARALLTAAREAPPTPIRAEELASLPAPVGRWLTRSGVVGGSRAETVRLRQEGALRTSPGGAWMPAHALQYFSVDEPAFVWRVETAIAGIVPISGRDRLAGGRGAMQILAGALVPIVDVDDDKIALGAMLRYLGEIIWFPSAALSRPIAWEPIDDRHARGVLRAAGSEVRAVFVFDEAGRVLRLEAERYMGGGDDAKVRPWMARCTEWKRVRGVEVPVEGDVAWNLPEGEFSYYRWRITDVETNVRSTYPAAPVLHRPAQELRSEARPTPESRWWSAGTPRG